MHVGELKAILEKVPDDTGICLEFKAVHPSEEEIVITLTKFTYFPENQFLTIYNYPVEVPYDEVVL